MRVRIRRFGGLSGPHDHRRKSELGKVSIRHSDGQGGRVGDAPRAVGTPSGLRRQVLAHTPLAKFAKSRSTLLPVLPHRRPESAAYPRFKALQPRGCLTVTEVTGGHVDGQKPGSPATSGMPQAQYYFCEAQDCDVVYFALDSQAPIFRRADLLVRVGVKETAAPIPVCYCFGFTRRDIEDEIAETGRSTIAERITTEVKAGNCACEVMIAGPGVVGR